MLQHIEYKIFPPNILYIATGVSLMEILVILLPLLFIVAYITVAERKTLANLQRRVGPNIVGAFGLLQAFADALKLLIKEYISPSQANILLFFLGPIITLTFSLYGFALIPFGPGISLNDFNLGIFYILAVSSLATYGILLAGWSANSKYAFLGSLRSTAQLISYELIMSSCLLLIIFCSGSLNLTVITEMQKSIWYVCFLLPLFVFFVIATIAETNRAPFDLAEAESELVSGYMTEHAASVFVFFFLAEYGSITLMCILITIVFIGGYDIFNFLNSWDQTWITTIYIYVYYCIEESVNIFRDLPIKGNLNFWAIILFNLTLALKTNIFMFIYIWVRASFPRTRFDQLMLFCWTVCFPIIISIIIIIPILCYNEEIVLFIYTVL